MGIFRKENGVPVPKAGFTGTIDNILNKFSNNAVSNKVVTEEFDRINADLIDLKEGVRGMLDFSNAVTLSTSDYLTTANGAVVGGGRGGSSNVLVYANNKEIGGFGTSSTNNSSIFVDGIKSGSTLKLSTSMGNGAVYFVPYLTV